MKNQIPFVTIVSILAISACATMGDGSVWECSAQGLVNSRYSGSDYVYIHLQGYSTGGNYPVKLNEQRTEGTGTTANGTPFKCAKQK